MEFFFGFQLNYWKCLLLSQIEYYQFDYDNAVDGQFHLNERKKQQKLKKQMDSISDWKKYALMEALTQYLNQFVFKYVDHDHWST